MPRNESEFAHCVVSAFLAGALAAALVALIVTTDTPLAWWCYMVALTLHAAGVAIRVRRFAASHPRTAVEVVVLRD